MTALIAGEVQVYFAPPVIAIPQVKGGRVVGVPTDNASGFGNKACYHATGTFKYLRALPAGRQLKPLGGEGD